MLKAFSCGCAMRASFLCPVTFLLIAFFSQHAYSDEIDALDLFDSLHEGRQLSVHEKRLQAHLMIHVGRYDRMNVIASFGSAENVPLDVKYALLMIDSQARREVTEDISRLAQANLASPSISTRWLQLLQLASHGSRTYRGGRRILEIEPFWLPELLRKLENDRAAWLAVARYGATILNIVESGSDIAGYALLMTPAYRSVQQTEGKQRAVVVLESARQNATREKWSEKYPGDNLRLEAALLYHADAIDESRVCYEKMITERIAEPSAYYRLSRIYEIQGRMEDAMATVQAGIRDFPEKNSILLVAAANYAKDKGDSEAAVRLLEQCLERSPEFPPAHLLLAEIEASRGNRDRAIRACADTSAYCYGWGTIYIDKINLILETMAESSPSGGGVPRTPETTKSETAITDRYLPRAVELPDYHRDAQRYCRNFQLHSVGSLH